MNNEKSTRHLIKLMKGNKAAQIKALFAMYDLEYSQNDLIINSHNLKQLKKMKTDKKEFQNEVETSGGENLDFFKFEKEGDSSIFVLGEPHTVKIEGEEKHTYKVIHEETGEEFILPTNVNLQNKVKKVYEILKDEKEPRIKITFEKKEKFEGSKFPTKVFSVKY